ncbi:FAD-dependent monooxygenase [Nonomuraea candida]|uniref:FAD-dependent monooxygenase n=1 Tax=Nonomuraea candida TaxID=359159 RepID=UPI0005BB300E|nr:FAD-dependent monooxygenase [Nonomuraea candida]
MSHEQELLVVGAGPAGLSAALAARSLGVEVTLIEADARDQERPGSRALFVHHETLARLERLSPGLGEKIAGFGVRWQVARTFYRGREVYARRYDTGPGSGHATGPGGRHGSGHDGEHGSEHDTGPGGGLPPYASLRQLDTERFLLDACRAAGVEPVWGARVNAVLPDPDGVTVRAGNGGEWRARYVIAADGARSAVRAALPIEMDGGRSSDYRVAVDLSGEDAGGAPAERHMHYRHPALDGRNLLIVPFTGGVQVDVQCRDPADGEALSDPDAVRRWLPKVVAPEQAERVLWVSRYPCLQRVATAFTDRHRRVLLAGEAAHLFAPLGARGMNSSIADAEAAATAVCLALHATGVARARGVVEDYDTVRRQAARHNRARVEGALRHLRAESARSRLAQAGAARLAPWLPRLGAWLDKAPYGPRGPITLRGGLY